MTEKRISRAMAILFSILPAALFGGDGEPFSFYADSPDMVDIYYEIFNIFAAFFRSGDYVIILKTAFLIGAAVMFVLGVMKTLDSRNPTSIKLLVSYLITVTILLILFFGNTRSIKIEAKNPTNYCPNYTMSTIRPNGVVVDNIPEMLGYMFAVPNNISWRISEITRSAFSANVDAIVKEGPFTNAVMHLTGVKELLKYDLSDLNVPINLGGGTDKKMSFANLYKAFVEQCVVIPSSSDTAYGPSVLFAIKHTGAPFKTLEKLISESKIALYKNPTSQPEYLVSDTITINDVEPRNLLMSAWGATFKCGDMFDKLKSAYDDIKNGDDLVCSPALVKYMNDDTFRVLTGGSVIPNRPIASELALNAGLINQMLEVKKHTASGDIPFSAGYSMADKALKEFGKGIYMMNILPYIQMALRAILYAFFPFVFVAIILPGGLKVLTEYFKTVLWIELWTPIMIVLSMFISMNVYNSFYRFYNENGFNVLNGFQVYTDSIMLGGVAGYLFALTPAIAWFVLRGSMALLGSLTGSFGVHFRKNLLGDDIAAAKAYRRNISNMEESGDISKGYAITKQGRTVASRSIEEMATLDKLAKMGKAMSLSRYNAQKSIMEGKSDAGEFLAKNDLDESNGEILMDIESGKLKEKFAAGFAADAAMTSFDDIKNVAASKSLRKSVEREMFSSKEDQENIDGLSKASATDEIGGMLSIGKQKEFLKVSSDQEFIQKVAGAYAYRESVKTQTASKISEGVSSSEKSSIDAMNKTASLMQSEGKFMIGTKEFIEAKVAKGKMEAANYIARETTVDTAGTEKIKKSHTIATISEIGQDLAIEKRFDIMSKTTGVGLGKSLLNQSADLSLLGKKHQGFEADAGDTYTDIMRGQQESVAKLNAGDSARKLEFGKEFGERLKIGEGISDPRQRYIEAMKEYGGMSADIAAFELTREHEKTEAMVKSSFKEEDYGAGLAAHEIRRLGVYKFIGTSGATALGYLELAMGGLYDLTTALYNGKIIIQNAYDAGKKAYYGAKLSLAYIGRKLKNLGVKAPGLTAFVTITAAMAAVYKQNEKVFDQLMNDTVTKRMMKKMNDLIEKLEQGIISAEELTKELQKEAEKFGKHIEEKYGDKLDGFKHQAIKAGVNAYLSNMPYEALVRVVTGGGMGFFAGTGAAIALFKAIEHNMDEAWKTREAKFSIIKNVKNLKEFTKQLDDESLKEAEFKLSGIKDNTMLVYDKETGEWEIRSDSLEDGIKVSDRTASYIIDVSVVRHQDYIEQEAAYKELKEVLEKDLPLLQSMKEENGDVSDGSASRPRKRNVLKHLQKDSASLAQKRIESLSEESVYDKVRSFF